MKGMLRTKCTVYCEVCSSPLTRKSSVETENTPEAIEVAKAEAKRRALKPYTCKTCASILASV